MRWVLVGAVLALGGCKDAREGVNPGECTDGADNDADGYFDCNDLDCALSPDCDDKVDTDTTSEETDDTKPGDTDPVVDTDPDVSPTALAGHLKSFSLTYRTSFKFDTFGETICETYFEPAEGKKCDCVSTYHGRGTLVEADGVANLYNGTFELVNSDCAVAPPADAGGGFANTSLNDAAIYRSSSGQSYTTFRFDGELTRLKEWIAHEFPEDNTTTQQPFDNHQWWIKLTVAARNGYDDAGTKLVDYAETEQTHIDLLLLTATHEVKVQFSESFTPPAYPFLDGGSDTDTDTP